MYVQTRSIRDFAFIDSQSERFSATAQFGKILRALYEHPDWSQIYNFCSKRYSKREVLSNRSARVLKPTKDGLGVSFTTNKTVTVNFNTDPSSMIHRSPTGLHHTNRRSGAQSGRANARYRSD
jgi:hypothetical protein